MKRNNSSGSLKCLKRMKAMDMDQELPQVMQTPHTVTSRKHFTVTPPFSLNGRLLDQETAVVCATRSGQQTTFEAQSKQDRRRMQKRRSAQKKRRKEKQNFLDLQAKNKELRTEREQMKSQILKLEANAGYAKSILSTIREMKLLTSSQRRHPPSPPAPPPQQPPAGPSGDGAAATTSASMSSATTMTGAVSPVSNQGLALRPLLGTVDQGFLWTGQQSVSSVPTFSSREEMWNLIPSDADLCDPISSRVQQQQLTRKGEVMPSSLPPTSVATGDISGDPDNLDQHQIIADFPTVSAMTSTMSEATSSVTVTAMSSYGGYTMGASSAVSEDDQDLIDFLGNYVCSPDKGNLAENTASTMLKDELRAPIPSPTKDSTGSPEPLSGPWQASIYTSPQDFQVVELKADDGVHTVSGYSENWVLSAQNFT